MSAAEPASGTRPCSAAAGTTSCQRVPARTRARRVLGSMWTPTMREVRTRIVSSSDPRLAAPCPVAWAATRSPSRRARPTTAAMSSATTGNATAAGRWLTARFHAGRQASQRASTAVISSPAMLPLSPARRAARAVVEVVAMDLLLCVVRRDGRRFRVVRLGGRREPGEVQLGHARQLWCPSAAVPVPDGDADAAQPLERHQQLLLDREQTSARTGQSAQVPLRRAEAGGLEVDHQTAGGTHGEIAPVRVSVQGPAGGAEFEQATDE